MDTAKKGVIMPDNSSVDVWAYPDPDMSQEAREALLDKLSNVDNPDGWSWSIDEADIIDEVALRWSNYDCPWGSSTAGETILKSLRDLGIGYICHDGGHFTWDANQVIWVPGWKDEVECLESIDGEILLSLRDLEHRPWLVDIAEASWEELRLGEVAPPGFTTTPIGLPERQPDVNGYYSCSIEGCEYLVDEHKWEDSDLKDPERDILCDKHIQEARDEAQVDAYLDSRDVYR